MTPTEAQALSDIRGFAAANRVVLTDHARLRMRQRGANYADVRNALVSGATCVAQPNGTFKVDGVDTDGDELTCVVAIEAGAVVVTIY